MTRLASALAALGLFAAPTPAADWPQWRGPDRDGVSHEKGLLPKWPAAGPKVAWTAKNLGLGFGAPSINAGVIYGIGSRDNRDGVWALKETTGAQLWFTPFGDTPRVLRQTNGPASTPTFAGGKLYAVSLGGVLGCFDAKSGKLNWSKNYVTDFGGKVPQWGFGESVLVDGDKVIGAPNSDRAAVVAFDAKSGDVIWKSEVGPIGNGAGYSSAVKHTLGGVPMYIVLLGDRAGLVGVHAETGKKLWSYSEKPATGSTAQIPTPVVRGDKIWVSTSYGGGAALIQLIPSSGGDFTVKELKAYRKPELNNHHGGMVLVGDHVYFGHDQNKGFPVCVAFETGEIAWGPEKNTSKVGGGDGSAAVLAAGGKLLFRFQNGVLALIEPSPEELKVVSTFKLPAPNVASYSQSWPHPVVANGKLYIRDQNVMYCYDVKAK